MNTSPSMTETEILEVVSGNTTIGTFSDRPLSYAVYVEPNGRLIGRISDGNSDKIELGSWRVDNNMLCGRWDNLKDGEENCFTYHRVGSNVHAYNTDGSLDRIQFFVESKFIMILGQNLSETITTGHLPQSPKVLKFILSQIMQQQQRFTLITTEENLTEQNLKLALMPLCY
jgi:hypothetical protein